MKKSLIATLAATFVFSIAGTSFAASNPFVDVPQGHWAYGYLNQLAKAHMIDGFNDGTFRGDQNMTRYEMATLVAKAMAKSDKADAQTKAALDKLQTEFASELQNLGVRVDNLEKKIGNVKISGDARVRYVSGDNQTTNPQWAERFRLVMTGDVNEDTSFYARAYGMNHNEMGTNKASNWFMADANFTTKNAFNLADVTVGRYSLNVGPTLYVSGTDGQVDGVVVNKNFGKLGLMATYGDIGAIVTTTKATNVSAVQAKYDFNKDVSVYVDYLKNQDKGVAANDLYDIFGGALVANVLPNVTLTGEYYKNSAETANDAKAYLARLQYKGANKAVAGSWGLAVEYLDMEANALPYGLTGAQVLVNNAKGWDVQLGYTLAKNITLDAMYQWNLKNAVGGGDYVAKAGDPAMSNRTRVQINYFF